MVRDLVLQGSRPEDLRETYLQGKVRRKKVLKMVPAWKRQAKGADGLSADKEKYPPRGFQPVAAVSIGTDAQQNTPLQTSISRMGEGFKRWPPQTPPPMSKEEHEKKIAKWAALVVDLLDLTGLGVCDREVFFAQVNAGLCGPFPWLFTGQVPRQHRLRAITDPWKFIKRCKLPR